jgi:tetratricopeptide (TPR) repeat protein
MTSRKLKFGMAGLSLFLCGAMLVRGAQQTPPQSSADNKPSEAAATPDHAVAYYHYMLAQRYKELAGIYNRGDYVDRSISEYKKAIAADPASLFLRVELAELYWRVSRVQDAIKEVHEVLQINPNQVAAHRLLGHIYLESLGGGQSTAATHEILQKTIAEYEVVARLDPTDSESTLMLGRLYKVNNEPQKAEAVFKKVLKDNPDSRAVLVNLTQLYFDQGDYKQIISLLQGIPENRLDPAILYLLGNSYTQTHDFDKAEETFQKALSRDPDSEDVRRAYAEALMAHGKMAKAREQLQAIIKANPQDTATYLRLAQLDRQTGRFDDARQDLQRARSIAPDNLEIPYQQAVLEDTLGNQAEAIRILEELLKKTEKPDGKYDPAEANNRAVFLQRLGLVYRSQEKPEKAIEVFDKLWPWEVIRRRGEKR